MNAEVTTRDLNFVREYQADWNKYAYDVLNVNLDPEQQQILSAVQHNARVSVRSGTARGKDYVSAIAALCFLFLFVPSKVLDYFLNYYINLYVNKFYK